MEHIKNIVSRSKAEQSITVQNPHNFATIQTGGIIQKDAGMREYMVEVHCLNEPTQVKKITASSRAELQIRLTRAFCSMRRAKVALPKVTRFAWLLWEYEQPITHTITSRVDVTINPCNLMR